MYAHKQIIYPDGNTKQGIRADALDVAAHFIGVFVTFFLVKLVFGESKAPWSFGISFLYLFFLGFTAFYLFTKQKYFSKKAVFPLCLCVISALSIALYGYTFSWIIPFLFYFSGLFCMGVTDTKGSEMNSYLDLYYQLKAILFIPVRKLFTPFISIIKNIRITKSKKYIGVILGFVCGIPVFLVVASLLVESDAAFNNVMDKFIKWFDELLLSDLDFLDPIYVIPTVIFAPYIISTVFSFRHGIVKEKLDCSNTENKVGELRFIPSSVLCGFYGVVAVCYVIYLLSQLSYLFGAFSGEMPMGTSMRLSDYARRGFFEMSAVAFINLLLIAFGAICSKRDNNGKVSVYYKCFSSFFCVFTMLLIITAMSKMALYITDMGLTHKRIAVSLADIVFFIAFLCILIKLFKRKFPYMKIIMYTSLVLVTAYFAVSPDMIIASYNTKAFLSSAHKELDQDYLSYNCDNYYSLINLDKVALGGKDEAERARVEVYRIYQWHDECVNVKIANSVNEHRLHNYIKQNEERIKTYQPSYDKFTYSLSDYPYISEENTVNNVFLITVKTDKTVKSVKFNNSIEDNYFDEFDEYALKESYTALYWSYMNDADVIADVKITLENGEVYECTMAKPTDDDAHYYTVKDDGKGGFVIEQQGSI